MRNNCAILYTIILVFLGVLSLQAQKDTAALVGTVLDSSGALVPNADVTAVSIETNFTYHAQSNESGTWTISPVRIGSYRITVTAKGFRTAEIGPVTLEVQQRQRIDVSLQPGQIQEKVEVQETAPLLETDNSERGQVVNSRLMSGLPLNGRNAVQLAQLTAGVTTSEPGARDETGFGFSANGARSLQNNFLLDGVDNNSNLPDLLNEANYVVMPSVDALQEFKVQTDSYAAEFGRANGAVVNATIKSGTNEVHGVLYEFLRNDKLDARNFFDSDRPPYKQNQFGAVLGGPIIHNKLFALGDYEGLRVRQAQTLTSQVPTAAQRNGDFSSYLDLSSPTGVPDCNGHMTYAGEIFDSTQTRAVPGGFCGVPFGYSANGTPLNVIPASKMDPLGVRLMNLYPLPNASANGYNYLSNPVQIQDRNQGDIRVDQVFSASDTAFYRFSASQQPSIIPGPFGGQADGGGFFTGDEQINGYSAAISETHIFSPSHVNEIRLGYNRLHALRTQFNANTDVSGQIGFPGVPYAANTNNGGLPQMSFNDAATLGSPTYLPSNEIQNTYSVSDTFTLVHGSHTWKFGGEFRSEEFTINQPAAPRGSLDFGTQFTDNAGAPGTGGSGLASLLTGQPDGGSINNLHNIDYFRKNYGAFIQDDWRVNRKLTLNLGIRYEFYSTVKERFHSQANFNPVTGQLDIPSDSSVSLTPMFASILTVNHTASDGLVHPDFNNVGPRVGLAYQINEKLVFRSAAGMFYGGAESGPYSNPSPGFNPPYFVGQSFNTQCGLAAANPAVQDCSIPGMSALRNGFPANSLVDPNTPTLFSVDPNLKTPYVWQWHGTLQYQPSASTLFETAYVGSKGTKLYTFLNINQASPTEDPSAPYDVRRKFSYVNSGISYFNSAGNSEYNALQVKFQRRFSGGLSVLANYTYSHALGNASSANLGAQNNSGFRWAAHPEWEHGNLDFDVRHRFVANYIWELPVGRGRHFGNNMARSLDYVIGQWQFSGITTISSGTWFTVTDSNGNFSNSDGQQRPDAVAGQNPNGKPCVAGTAFNTCAFVDPALGSFGNVGQNTVRGPGVQEWDFSLLKTIPVGEKRRFEFRAEFFNIANHANFLFAKPGPQNSNNATSFGTPTFGYVTAARAPRQIQFGLKFYF